jgi:Co/Zn/Cd efflux system component
MSFTCDCCDEKTLQNSEKRTLWAVLLINFAFFVIEMTSGFWSNSMGLVADSLDMLADSIVYGLALLAVGGAAARKKNVAKAMGIFQILLAVLGFAEVLKRFFGASAQPEFRTMIIVSVFALVANAVCLYLLQKSKNNEAHIRASMICTSNDVIVNVGIIVAGVLVHLLHSGYPDLVVGAIVFAFVMRGAVRILRL